MAMLKSLSLNLRMSEVRQKITEFPDDGADTDRDALTGEYASLDSQYRAALITEQSDAENDPDAGQDRRGDDPAEREIARLLDRVSAADYMNAAAAGLGVSGAAAELRCATLGDDCPAEYMPLDVLRNMPAERQYRVDAVTSIGASIQDNQSSIAGRLFAMGSGDYLGWDRPTVAFGQQSYVSLTMGGTADFRLDGVALDAAAAAFTTKSINPSRVQSRIFYDNIIDVKMRGASDSLAADLRMQLTDKLDAVGLNGQAAVANVSPALVGVISALPNPTNPGAVGVWTDFLDAYDDAVDGKIAMDADAIRMLVNANTWKYARGLQIATSGDLLRDRLPSGRFRVSANMPPTPTTGADANVATALAYAAGPGRGFTQAIWRGVRLVRDIYTNSSEDQTSVTATMYCGQDMVDPVRYRRLEFQTA